jgi:hypothetical protein
MTLRIAPLGRRDKGYDAAHDAMDPRTGRGLLWARSLWRQDGGLGRQRQGEDQRRRDRDRSQVSDAGRDEQGDDDGHGHSVGRRLVGTRRLVAAACLALGCEGGPAGTPTATASSPTSEPAARSEDGLRAEELALVASIDFRAPPDTRDQLGPDPAALVTDPDGWVVVLEQTPPRLVLLDAEGTRLDETAAPAGARALARAPAGLLLVGSPTSPDLAAFRVDGGRLVRAPAGDLLDFATNGVRSLSAQGACVFGADETAAELALRCGAHQARVPVPRWPSEVFASERYVLVTSPISHVTTVLPRTPHGVAAAASLALANDGPIFSACAVERGDTLVVARAGVEDHPLDRRGGSFGYIDSFVFVDVVRDGHAARVASFDVSALGVITPKALLCELDDDRLQLSVGAYGSGRAVEITLPLDGGVAEAIRAFDAVPGLVQLARAHDGSLLAPSRLLDATFRLDASPSPLDHVPEPDSDEALLRLGEALFFTSALAPWQSSDGQLSRFTCETCHFEGGVDGRVHATGRADVVATTKPLFGLANNGPHFTRALDDDLTEMVFAEFRVGAANSGHSEWFDLDEAELPWLPLVPFYEGVERDPQTLRRALLHYLAATPHPPRAHPRERFTSRERRGAELFADRCSSCHASRLVTRDPASAVPLESWEPLVLSTAGPIVWARDGYEKTGVQPYVHPDGARPSSLRRIARKRPYFTNGSAETLRDVLNAARFGAGTFLHAGGVEGMSRLSADEIAALEAFLALL